MPVYEESKSYERKKEPPRKEKKEPKG